MAERYNISGTAYDDTGAPAQLRDVYVYKRSSGELLRSLKTDINGVFGAWMADQTPLIIVIKPGDGDVGNAKVYDNVVPTPGIIESGINSIGIPGQWGYGQGICPNPPSTMEALPGYNDPTNQNYGNYRYSVDGSIMVWIPAFWFKMGNGTNGVIKNGISLKDLSTYANDAAAAADGYVFHRAFIDGGERKQGFFIDKYRNSRNKTLNCPSSVLGAREFQCSYNSTVNAYPQWNGTNFVDFGISPGNTVTAAQMLDVAAMRGNGIFNILTNFQATALWMIWLFQKQEAALDTPQCAWKNTKTTGYWIPRGWNNGQSQYFDNIDRDWFELVTMNRYPSEGGLSGLCYPFDLSTHNGQKSGIHGISGGLLEICIGVMALSTSNPNITQAGTYLMKESVKASSFRTNNYNNGNQYDFLHASSQFPPHPVTNAWSGRLIGGGNIQTFNPTTDRTSNDYKYLVIAGIPTKTESFVNNTNNNDGLQYWGGAIYVANSYSCFWTYGGSKNTTASVTNQSVGPGCFTMDISAGQPKSDMGMRLSLYI